MFGAVFLLTYVGIITSIHLLMKSIKILIILIVACFGSLLASAQEQTIETVIQTGHYATVRTVAFSSDGKFAATGSADKTIKLW